MTDAKTLPTCGFIGMGDQGGPMARRMIEAGFPTVLWARRPETLEPYRGTAALFADSVADLGAQAEHVGVCVVNDEGVRQVCGELIPAMRAGGRIAIHSTIHPDTVREVAAQAEARGIAVIDAPVSGGRVVAEAGGLTLMLGGDAEAIEKARPVFETFGKLILRLGDVGSGQYAKLINNTLLVANMAVANGALAAGESLGIDRGMLVDLIMASSGRSLAVQMSRHVPTPEQLAHGAALLRKDVSLLADVIGVDNPTYASLFYAAEQRLNPTRA